MRIRKYSLFFWSTAQATILAFASPILAADVTALSVSANGHYFLDGNGRPFLYFGDTQWNLWQDFTLEDARSIIDNRRAKGFTEFNVMIVGTSNGKTNNKYGQRPFLNDDASTPNASYFATMDSVVHMCRCAGIVVVTGVHHSGFWGSLITSQNARAYARWLGDRYRNDPNIIWCPTYDGRLDASSTLLNDIIAGLKEGDGGSHLMTRHPDPWAGAVSQYQPFQNLGWLSFQSLQTYQNDYVIPSLVRGMWELSPIKPVFEAEAGYEGEGPVARDCRKQAYYTFLSGGFYTYGNGGNWLSTGSWKQWIDAPGNLQVVHARDLLASLDWWNLVPDQTIISGPANENIAARSANGAWMLVYLPSAGSVTINLAGICTSDSATAWWIDPTNGVQTKIGTCRATGTRSFPPPNGWVDAVLLLEKQGGITAIKRPYPATMSSPAPRQRTTAGFSVNRRYDANGHMAATFNVRGQRVSHSFKRAGDGPNARAAALEPRIHRGDNGSE
jgi:hypothetical protein